MIAAVCLDDRGGMRFNHRRQSRDRLLYDDLIRLCGTIWVREASVPLFSAHADRIRIAEDPLSAAGPGECCFVEDDPLTDIPLEGMIVYRWNRLYPADLFLTPAPADRGMILISSTEFPGSSHERITREIWRATYDQIEIQ